MNTLSDRFRNLVTFDKLRIFKILEIAQYSLIFIVLNFIIGYMLNKYYFKYVPRLKDQNPDLSFKSFLRKFSIIYMNIFLLCVLLFYIKKIAQLFPSVMSFLSKKYRSHTTLPYTLQIAAIVVIIEILPKFVEDIKQLMDYLLLI